MCGAGSENVYVCVWKAKVECAEGAACCSVLTAAGEQCYGPWQLVKGSTALQPLPPCCVLVQHTSKHTQNAALSGAGERTVLAGSLSATGTKSTDWVFLWVTRLPVFLFSLEPEFLFCFLVVFWVCVSVLWRSFAVSWCQFTPEFFPVLAGDQCSFLFVICSKVLWPSPVGILWKTSALVVILSACPWLLICVQLAEKLLYNFYYLCKCQNVLSSNRSFSQMPNILYKFRFCFFFVL